VSRYPDSSSFESEAWTYCEATLPLVSRTFALNIRQLNGTLYRSVLIGYLLFRMADTLEDSPALTEEEKVAGLSFFAEFFRQGGHEGKLLADVYPLVGKLDLATPEGELLTHFDWVLHCYMELPPTYREIIANALIESVLGMARFQQRKGKYPSGIFQLTDWNDLTLYCYYVAGVVGKMLTTLFCLEKGMTSHCSTLSHDQVHFGLALQLTNITKDYPDDIARGWCYLPQTVTDAVGVTPGDLLRDPDLKRRDITRLMIEKTAPHLKGALRYIEEIPREQRDVRMFCMIPFVLAYHTLENLSRTLNPRLSRQRVQILLERCKVFCASNVALESDYATTFLRGCLCEDPGCLRGPVD